QLCHLLPKIHPGDQVFHSLGDGQGGVAIIHGSFLLTIFVFFSAKGYHRARRPVNLQVFCIELRYPATKKEKPAKKMQGSKTAPAAKSNEVQMESPPAAGLYWWQQRKTPILQRRTTIKAGGKQDDSTKNAAQKRPAGRCAGHAAKTIPGTAGERPEVQLDSLPDGPAGPDLLCGVLLRPHGRPVHCLFGLQNHREPLLRKICRP